MFIIFACLLVFLGFVWLEWRKRTHLRSFLIRSVLLFIGLGSLVVIFLKPQKDAENVPDETKITENREKTEGIRSVFWEKKLFLGDTLLVFGKYEKTDNRPIQVFLEQNGEIMDSVKLEKTGFLPFRLKFFPKEKGCFVLNLGIKNAKNEYLQTEKIPFEVQNLSAKKLLFLQNAPDPELRFLKDWLGKKGNEIGIITQTSKEKRRTEWVNTNAVTAFFSADFLEKQDLVVIDWETANGLSANELKTLEKALRNGLGVLLLPDDRDLVLAKNPAFLRFEFLKEADLTYRTVKPVAQGESQTFSQLSDIEAFPYSIKPTFSEKTLLTDGFEQALVCQKRYGKGKIGTTLLKNSQQWIQEGNPQYFDQYWAWVLENLYREKVENQVLVRNFIPKVGTRNEIEFWADTADVIEIGGEKIYLTQNAIEPYRWESVFWAKKEGWQSIRTQTTEQNWYVFGENDWKTLHEAASPDQKKWVEKIIRQETINLWYFFAFFVLSFGLLWGADRRWWRL